MSRRTPGSFRTRVLTDGDVPSLHAQYTQAKIKQHHKGQALRTETTINNTYDFEIGRGLRNLPALPENGFAANRRLLRVEYLSHDCLIGDDALDGLTRPVVLDTQRAAALRLGDRRVLALMRMLSLLALHPSGFRHRDVRSAVAQLLGRALDDYGPGQMPTTCVAVVVLRRHPYCVNTTPAATSCGLDIVREPRILRATGGGRSCAQHW